MAEFFQEENDLKPTDGHHFLSCPLCFIKRRIFSCDSCIRNGDFSHSKGKYSERYTEKLKKLQVLKQQKIEYQQRVQDVIRRKERTERLNCDVTLGRQKVSLLRIVVDEASAGLNTDLQMVNALEESNSKVESRLAGYANAVQDKQKQNQQCQANIMKNKKELDRVVGDLCEVRRKSITRIQKYLFPIQVHPVYQVLGTPPPQDGIDIPKDIECDVESEHDNDDDESRESELAEATRTSYIEGRWVSEEEEMRMEYSVNDAYLPANGNYSAYNDWVKSHKNGTRGPGATSDDDIPTRNPAYMITAALTHACQMVELMAFFLDVNLPKKISYSEFCHYELSKKEFQSAVDRLNTNILHLCFTQKSCDVYNSESEDECVEMEENVSLRKAPKRLAGIDERPSENIEAKRDLILSRLDAIERHLSMNTFRGPQGTPPCIKKPKYEIQGASNVSDVGEASGVGSSPTASLHVEPSLLYSKRTLHNLYTCVNSLHLGRGGSFECYPKLLTASDESNETDAGTDTDVATGSESGNSESDTEWENLPANLLDIPEVPSDQRTLSQALEQNQQTSEPATAASLVSSAAASVAALWPWKK